jgi:hypothetical protein
LPFYDGVVTLDESDVPVIVELGDDHIRLSASGTEIGDWPSEECHIAHVSDSIYSITAEDETLRFVPNQPTLFAEAVNGNGRDLAPAARAPAEAEVAREAPATAKQEAPPPKPLTMALFYALCLITAALGLWSLVSIVF